jgi:hypothetical protein
MPMNELKGEGIALSVPRRSGAIFLEPVHSRPTNPCRLIPSVEVVEDEFRTFLKGFYL